MPQSMRWIYTRARHVGIHAANVEANSVRSAEKRVEGELADFFRSCGVGPNYLVMDFVEGLRVTAR